MLSRSSQVRAFHTGNLKLVTRREAIKLILPQGDRSHETKQIEQ
jgi:hypothetical protein